MANITMERLTLKLSALSERDGQRLAMRIAEDLAKAMPTVMTGGHRDSLRVTLTATPGNNMEQIAAQVVADIVRQIERTI